MAAHNSSLHASRNTYSYSKAYYGGVIATSASSLNFANSTFTYNSAAVIGGVMDTYESSLTITNSNFSNNIAHLYGITYHHFMLLIHAHLLAACM